MKTYNTFNSTATSQYDGIEYKADTGLDLNNPPSSDIWSYEYLLDTIFNDLMNCEDYDKNWKIHKYIIQMIEKFQFFRIKSPNIRIDIYKTDLGADAKKQIDEYIKDCKTREEAYHKLDGIITEVIALIYKQAEPLILSSIKYEDIVWVKKSINEIRTSVSNKWRFV